MPDLAAGREDPRVDEPVQDHRRRVNRAVIGDAPAAHHARLDAERALHIVELRPAAVHHHDADSEVVQDCDLLHQRARAGEVAEDCAARLDDEDLALVEADVRRSAPQGCNHRGLVNPVRHHLAENSLS